MREQAQDSSGYGGRVRHIHENPAPALAKGPGNAAGSASSDDGKPGVHRLTDAPGVCFLERDVSEYVGLCQVAGDCLVINWPDELNRRAEAVLASPARQLVVRAEPGTDKAEYRVWSQPPHLTVGPDEGGHVFAPSTSGGI
jgi:hypothetical protein